MNTKLSNKEMEKLQSEFDLIFSFENENDQIEVDSNVLMAKFLSQVQEIANQKGVNRKVLASLINSSPSYLTQIFRGQKPLNFLTLAKFQRALDFEFEISIKGQEKMASFVNEDMISQNINKWFYDNKNGDYFKIIRNFKSSTETLDKPYHLNKNKTFKIA